MSGSRIVNYLRPVLKRKVNEVEAYLKKVAPKRKGALQASVSAELIEQDRGLLVRLKHNRYAFILYYMAQNQKVYPRAKKGQGTKRKGGKLSGKYKGSSRLTGATQLPPDSPLKQNPLKYEVMIAYQREFVDEMKEVALATILDKAIEDIQTILNL